MNMINKFASRQSKFNQIKQSRIPHLVNGWMDGWLDKEQRSRGSIVYSLSAYLCEFYVTFVNIIKRNLDTCGGYSVITYLGRTTGQD